MTWRLKLSPDEIGKMVEKALAISVAEHGSVMFDKFSLYYIDGDDDHLTLSYSYRMDGEDFTKDIIIPTYVSPEFRECMKEMEAWLALRGMALPNDPDVAAILLARETLNNKELPSNLLDLNRYKPEV